MVSIILTKREHASTPVGLGRRCVMSFSIYKSVFIYRNNEYKTAADVPNRKFETSSCFVEKKTKEGHSNKKNVFKISSSNKNFILNKCTK